MKNVRFDNTAETLETLSMATEAAGLGIWDLDLFSGDLHLSERCREILGLAHDRHVSWSTLEEIVHPDDRGRVAAALASVIKPGDPDIFDIEYRILSPDHELRWLTAKGKCFLREIDGKSKAGRVLGTILDQTEKKAAEHALMHAEQLAATGRLAASIAHEINNPLESITNLLYLLRGEHNEAQRNTYLALAEAELSRVSEITVNTLRFYRDPAGITEVHIPNLLHSVLSLFHGQMAIKEIELHLKLEEETRLNTAQGELRQVLVNIIGNALDALPKGGRLRVHCRRFVQPVGRLGKGVGICIADTGHGMHPDVLKRIFDPFYTTKGSAGTGLGLWLSMELLKKHGYRVRVKSKQNKGTTFSLFLPEATHALAVA